MAEIMLIILLAVMIVLVTGACSVKKKDIDELWEAVANDRKLIKISLDRIKELENEIEKLKE